jgi:acyl-CoA thioesterase FadM
MMDKTLFDFELQGKVKESDLSASGFVEHVRIAEWLHESRVQYLKDKKAGVYEIALAASLIPAVSNL